MNEPKYPDWYKFSLSVFDLEDPYHRWVISFCQSCNDMQFFHHLVSIYVPEASSAIPEELHRGELRSILIHAMAHTFEALTLLLDAPEPVRQRVAREMAAVSDSVTAQTPRVRSWEMEDLNRRLPYPDGSH